MIVLIASGGVKERYGDLHLSKCIVRYTSDSGFLSRWDLPKINVSNLFPSRVGMLQSYWYSTVLRF